jgi:uncharacterized protein
MTDGRPWPTPAEPWVMAQTWHDLLFLHWSLAPETLAPLIPEGLTLDTFADRAWLGVVPFHMSGIHLRRWPACPGAATFPELNVRTYVTHGGKPGVWFLSLDAGSRLAVAVARRWFHLPYYHARMRVATTAAGVTYASRRGDRRGPPASLVASYRPTGDVFRAGVGSLEAWLTARYCLYARDGRGRLYRGEIDHAPWPLQPADADVSENSTAVAVGVRLPPEPPLRHFARRLEVRVWPPRRVAVGV